MTNGVFVLNFTEVLVQKFATEALPGAVRFGVVWRRMIEQPWRLTKGFWLVHYSYYSIRRTLPYFTATKWQTTRLVSVYLLSIAKTIMTLL